MATRRIIKDKDFGQIVIGTRRTARNITMRVRPDGLHVTVPPYSKTEKVMATLETFRERLLEQYRKVEIRPIEFFLCHPYSMFPALAGAQSPEMLLH